MALRYRKTKTFGGIRVTATHNGVGVSYGAGPLRVGVSPTGQVRQTVRMPGGVYDTRVLGNVNQQRQATPQLKRNHIIGPDGKPQRRVGPVMLGSAWLTLILGGLFVVICAVSLLIPGIILGALVMWPSWYLIKLARRQRSMNP